MSKTLQVLLDDRRAGTVESRGGGTLRFVYEDSWRTEDTATPLSLSMPLAGSEFPNRIIEPFLWNLLPDNEAVLTRWGRDYGVSPRNAFALLGHVGKDCAGAVQFVRPDRLVEVPTEEGVEWFDEADVASRLRQLRADPTAWHDAAGSGQFSLAGAQSKMALFHEDGKWGRPIGRTPTTHILKPAVHHLDDHDLNEHLCLEMADRLGLRAARSWIQRFDDERAVVVERYDRLRSREGWVRVHQEDLCQALALPPTKKYQNQGGPTPPEIVRLFRVVQPGEQAERSIWAFLDALALNWLIAGTDAHAKNYSLLLSGQQVRLAPLYDVASALPYDRFDYPRLSLAMKIGTDYSIERISRGHWLSLAAELHVDGDALVERVSELARRAPDALSDACQAADVLLIESDLPSRLLGCVTEHVQRCQRLLAG